MANKSLTFAEIKISNGFSPIICTHVDWEPRTNIIDVIENDESDQWIVEVELPGVKEDEISIVLEDKNCLIIRGIKRQPRSNDYSRVTYFLFEREFGSFYKRIPIPFPVDETKIKSVMENGVLTVKISRKKTETISVEIK